MQHVDPVDAVSSLVRSAVVAALGNDYADADPQVRRSDRADLQADLAMRLARIAKRPRASRLALTQLVARTLSSGLALVGIDVPERM